jgi:ComF family protein
MLRGMSFLHSLADLLYPPACLLCRQRIVDASQPWCEACHAAMPLIGRPICPRCGIGLPGAYDAQHLCAACRDSAPGFDLARSAWWYRGPVQDAVQQFKYHRRWRVGQHLAEAMAQTARNTLPLAAIDAVLPVPLFWLKRRARGFNPAQLLAQTVAQSLGKPLHLRGLRRTRWTTSQTRLHGRNRIRNVRDAFTADAPSVGGRTILLVDDVLTSGATAAACAQALKSAGARGVFVLTAARTPLA